MTSWLHRRPVVSVLHHAVSNDIFSRAAAIGAWRSICLTEAAYSSLPRAVQRKATVLPWGPDLQSPLYAGSTNESAGVVSAGKSNRDLSTLYRAIREQGGRGLIYDTHDALRGTGDSRVRIVKPGGTDGDPAVPSSYLAKRVISDISSASVVAMPALNPNRLTGLTEVNDALAFGKPLIVTRSKHFPIDIEAVGCGIFVQPGDVDGWKRALQELESSAVRVEMGQLGRRFAEDHWNYAAFSEGLLHEIEKAH
jgi:glycosyltransferase involved in cell wall biosynthesis